MGTFLTNYTCSVAPGRRLVSVAGAPLPGTGATSAGSTPRARTDRRRRRAPSGSLHGGGRAGRRQKPSMGKFTWSRTSPLRVLSFHLDFVLR